MKVLLRAVCLSLLTACAATGSSPELRSGKVPSFDGLAIAYDVRGQGNPALVFVHGWSCNRTHWEDQVQAFKDEHRVVTIDLGGHGGSGTDRETWDLPSLARDVQAVVEHLDLERVILVGHSMGGPVSLHAAALMPERVVGVVGADTLHNAEFEWNEGVMEPFIQAFESDFPGTMEQFIRGMSADSDSQLIDRLLHDTAAMDPAVAVALMRSYSRLDARQAFRDCPAPIRCINATSPVTETEINRRYARSFEAVVMEDVGHFLMLEDPEGFSAHLRKAVSELSGGR